MKRFPQILLIVVLLGGLFALAATDSGEIPADGSAGATGKDIDSATLNVSNVSAKAIKMNSAQITWRTDIPANSYVEFGKTTDYGRLAGKDDSAKTHSVQLTGLQPDTAYHFRAESKSSTGASVSSKDFSFRTKKDGSADTSKTNWLWITVGALVIILAGALAVLFRWRYHASTR